MKREKKIKVMTVISHWRERSKANRHYGEPSCMGVNFPRWSHNPNQGFTEGLRVSNRRIVGRKVGYSKPSMHTPVN
jgi:hypothetical protein